MSWTQSVYACYSVVYMFQGLTVVSFKSAIVSLFVMVTFSRQAVQKEAHSQLASKNRTLYFLGWYCYIEIL